VKITPLDIQKKTFRTVWRGLDADEVDGFLDLVAHELEEVIKENIAFKEDLRRKTSRLEEYAEREKVLQETLLTAQKITGDIKEQARKEGELLIADAERQAQKIVQEAHQRLVGLIRDINELKRARTQFSSGVRQLVESHKSLLDALGDQPAPDTREIEDNVAYLTPRAASGEGDGGAGEG
jgi:cell division initiation protein